MLIQSHLENYISNVLCYWNEAIYFCCIYSLWEWKGRSLSCQLLLCCTLFCCQNYFKVDIAKSWNYQRVHLGDNTCYPPLYLLTRNSWLLIGQWQVYALDIHLVRGVYHFWEVCVSFLYFYLKVTHWCTDLFMYNTLYIRRYNVKSHWNVQGRNSTLQAAEVSVNCQTPRICTVPAGYLTNYVVYIRK